MRLRALVTFKMAVIEGFAFFFFSPKKKFHPLVSRASANPFYYPKTIKWN
jgi:hypothetical protein